MLNTCNHNHDEICFEGHHCPLCAMRDEKDQRIAELEQEVKELEANQE